MSVRPPGKNAAPLGGFSWNLIFEYFWKICRENGRITCTFHEHLRTFMIICRSIVPRMRNVSSKVLEQIKTHTIYSITLFPESRAVYELMWKTMVEPHRTQLTKKNGFACRITKATETHSEHVILITFPVTRTRLTFIRILPVLLH